MASVTVPYLPASTSFCAANVADLSILVLLGLGQDALVADLQGFRSVSIDTAGNAGSVRQPSGSSWMLRM